MRHADSLKHNWDFSRMSKLLRYVVAGYLTGGNGSRLFAGRPTWRLALANGPECDDLGSTQQAHTALQSCVLSQRMGCPGKGLPQPESWTVETPRGGT